MVVEFVFLGFELLREGFSAAEGLGIKILYKVILQTNEVSSNMMSEYFKSYLEHNLPECFLIILSKLL